MRVKLSDITKYSKGTQINGDELIEDVATGLKELFDKEKRDKISYVEKTIITGSGAENIRDAIKYCAYKNV